MSDQSLFDVLIVGGGINGCGIARDAAGRGLSVALCEMNDLASATSSCSSKLIHGGLRYLELGEFRLVREALAERETLLQIAPHIIWPLRFRLPLRQNLRPAWQIRIGLWLYDHLARRDRLPASSRLTSPDPLLSEPDQTVFEYSDAWVDDARLVILNALDAQNHGAKILPGYKCIEVSQDQDHWQITLKNQLNGESQIVRAKALINATGPWVETLFHSTLQGPPPHAIRLVKGSHIVVPALYREPHAYILQNNDRRIVFTLPFEDQFTLIGTTDVDHIDTPDQVTISQEETAYLLNSVNHHLSRQLCEADIVHSFAGVRPLLDDHQNQAQSVTRDYTLTLDSGPSQPPLLSVFGGKITTYRKLAEAAMHKLKPCFPAMTDNWTAYKPLPGGDIQAPEAYDAILDQRYPWLADELRQRYVRSYGSLTEIMLSNCCSKEDLGQHFGGGLYQAEVDYLREHEWARTAEDILWRRTKRGLHLTREQIQRLEHYLTDSA